MEMVFSARTSRIFHEIFSCPLVFLVVKKPLSPSFMYYAVSSSTLNRQEKGKIIKFILSQNPVLWKIFCGFSIKGKTYWIRRRFSAFEADFHRSVSMGKRKDFDPADAILEWADFDMVIDSPVAIKIVEGMKLLPRIIQHPVIGGNDQFMASDLRYCQFLSLFSDRSDWSDRSDRSTWSVRSVRSDWSVGETDRPDHKFACLSIRQSSTPYKNFRAFSCGSLLKNGLWTAVHVSCIFCTWNIV